jgi:putative phosphoesterase
MNEKQNNSTVETCGGGEVFVFAVATLQPLLNTLQGQIEGATQATDIEYIHKLRVTSRRIRAALSVFKTCFPKESYRRWRLEIRNVTQSLGAARDMDVQLQFLENHLQTLSNIKEKSGIEYLLKQQRQHRVALQPDVIAHLQRLKESGVIEEMTDLATMIPTTVSLSSSNSFAPYTVAQQQISCCFTDFLTLQEYINQETEITKHHEMRIAAKHLRYTMELFSPLYDQRLVPYITMMKEFQDILGEMHDCDVWSASIPTILEKLKQSHDKKTDNDTSNQYEDIKYGLVAFLQFIRSRRHALYTEFVQLWEKYKNNSTLSSLKSQMNYSAVLPSSYPKKIAVLADVHGNLDALKAILQDARNNQGELILNLGDLVGYGAFPQEVVMELHAENVLSILGNFDKEVLEWKKNHSLPLVDEKEISLQYAMTQLQKSSFQFLKSLPIQMKLCIGEKSLLLVHGSPESIDEHIYPNTPDERVKELCQQVDTDVLMVGHSHMPFLRTIDQMMIVNPGSVGRPGDGDPRASYALLTVHPFSVELKKVPYDVMHAVDAIRQRHLPERFIQMLLQGTSLEKILDQELRKTTQKHGLLERLIFMRWKNKRKKQQIKKCAERYTTDFTHATQVTHIAQTIFNQLQPIHPLGPEDLFWLESAGLLHDIGLSQGVKGHHKTSFRLILTDPFLPLTARERKMIGLIARYHRKKPPSMLQDPFRSLPLLERTRIEMLAAMLRVADGLDASHNSIIEKVDMEITDTTVMMRCLANGNTQLEEEMANKKKDLFEKVFNRSLLITMQVTSNLKEKSLDS